MSDEPDCDDIVRASLICDDGEPRIAEAITDSTAADLFKELLMYQATIAEQGGPSLRNDAEQFNAWMAGGDAMRKGAWWAGSGGDCDGANLGIVDNDSKVSPPKSDG